MVGMMMMMIGMMVIMMDGDGDNGISTLQLESSTTPWTIYL